MKRASAISALLAVAAIVSGASSHASLSSLRAHGLWVRNTGDLMADATPLLEACKKTGTNEVYIAVTPDLLVDERLAMTIAELDRASIRVEALIGDPSWYRADRSSAMLSAIDQVVAFNARRPFSFAAIHLDVEPDALPENRSADVMTYLPMYIAAMQSARDEAARGGLSIGADISPKALTAPDATRRALTQTVPRLFLTFSDLRRHSEVGDAAPNEVATESADNLRFAYDPMVPQRGQMIIGIRVADYAARLPMVRSAVDRANGSNPAYGGWAVHDYAELRAITK